MKNMFSKNATYPVAYQKLIGLFLLFSCFFYSCKKEVIPGDDLKVGATTDSKAKIQSISYEKFASSVNAKQLGTLKRLVAPSSSNLNIQVAGSGTLSEVTISTDQVKRLEVSDTVSYVLSMELESSNSPTFRNLTIQQAKGKTTAFISTYTPTKEWILKRRATGHNPKFEGTVTYQMVPLSEQGNQVQAQMTCGYFVKFELVDMPCVGTGAQQHYNPEDCQYGTGEGGPWQDLVATVQWGCEGSGGGGPSGNPGDGGTGNTGGGGNTTPNYPEGYDPCASGEIKCSVPGSGTTPAQQLATQLDITDVKQIAFLDANLTLVTFLQNYRSTNGNSIERDNFARWVVAYLTANIKLANEVKSYLNTNPTHEPIVILALKDVKNGAITWGEFETLSVLFQNQGYVPRDKEPVSYNWRNKLTSTDFGDYLVETTPKIIVVNGKEVKNVEAYNCHYHAFGTESASLVDPEYPKLVYNIDLSKWKIVTSNLQVGDRVLYFSPDINRQLGQTLTHSAIVIEVDSEGYATKVSSKMGTYQILEHHPRDVPNIYGVTNVSYDYKGTTYPSRMYFRKK